MTIDLSDPTLLAIGGGVLLFVLAIVSLAIWLMGRQGSRAAEAQAAAVRHLIENQSELAGRVAQLAEQSANGQLNLQGSVSERLQAQERAITRTLEERLADLNRRMGESMQKQSTQTQTTIGELKERLGAINAAQDRITKLSEQVVSLQDVLSNKQARGGFGEIQLEDQVKSALPPSAYAFQAVLSNQKRADCLLKLPNPPGPIVVDSKFPLEGFNAIRQSPDGEERTRARKAFGRDVMVHVTAIAEKYIIPGETADCALLFLPSEAVYAELHAELPDVVEKAHQRRVYITSPTTLMALLNTIRAVLKDTQMREQAGLIQKEVRKLNEDVGRLSDRVGKLRRNFDTAHGTIKEIETSAEKISKSAEKIEAVELAEVDALEAPKATGASVQQSREDRPQPTLGLVEGGGQ
ncbi:DNA recombination protein RmuC [Hwanghaeella sp.]|uniref:DNA recombination protein RmuC n=1 Tax=Hwanghaeella sp. TaxID=2605943 RepID=UPI003CCBBB70